MASLALALRTYVRYVIPLTVLSALVLAPAVWITLRVPIPGKPHEARTAIAIAWSIAGSAWTAQLILVGAAAPLVRSIARGAPITQVRALGVSALQLARTIVPCMVAIAAIAIGGLALVAPGLVLLAALAMTGASTECGLPAPLVDSVETARRNLRLVAAVVAAIVVIDLAIALVAQLAMTRPIVKKPSTAQLAAFRDMVRAVPIALIAFSPLAACALAAIHARHHSERNAS